MQALDGQVAGSVFKVQANLDPRHRDRVAYLRICSGRFERGMGLVNHRTGRAFSTKYANQLFGRERETVEVAYPGDVVGLVGAGDVRIGDTLSEDGRVVFLRYRRLPPSTSAWRATGIPAAPSSFARGSPSWTRRA